MFLCSGPLCSEQPHTTQPVSLCWTLHCVTGEWHNECCVPIVPFVQGDQAPPSQCTFTFLNIVLGIVLLLSSYPTPVGSSASVKPNRRSTLHKINLAHHFQTLTIFKQRKYFAPSPYRGSGINPTVGQDQQSLPLSAGGLDLFVLSVFVFSDDSSFSYSSAQSVAGPGISSSMALAASA